MKDNFLNKFPFELQEIFSSLNDIFSIDVIHSVILVGSAARGELSYYEKNKLYLRSDLEFYIITENSKQAKLKVSASLKALELKYNSRWPEFHIDVSYLTKKQFVNLKPWIRHYELIENGKIFKGDNIIKLLSEITINNLDYRELNEIVLWRMLALLSRFPSNILNNRENIPSNFSFSLARNILDLTTWLLPGKGILIPNYTDRVSFWNNVLDQETKEIFSFIDNDVLEECILCRRKKTLDLDANDLLYNTIKSWLLVYEIVKGRMKFKHSAYSKGFRKINFLKLIRALYRIRFASWRMKYNMIKIGPSNLFAEVSKNLLKCLNDWNNRKKYLDEVGKLLAIDFVENDTENWMRSRNILMTYVDAYLNSNQWTRYINK